MTTSQTNPGQLRPAGGDPGSIIRVDAERRTEAIERLVSRERQVDRVAAEQFLHFAANNGISLDSLWARLTKDGSVESAVLGVQSPGRTAMMFATHPQDDESIASISRVVDRACSGLAEESVELAQALLEPEEQRDREMFRLGGFTELATLTYLERTVSRQTPGPRPTFPQDVTIEAYTDDAATDLAAVVEASYVETLDCPGLRGLRRIEDIIAGHRATGVFEPELWTLLRVAGEAVGIILLNSFPAHRTAELVYIGLKASARRRGLGRELLRHAIHQLARRRERKLTLAVDQGNEPALALYEANGFQPVVERIALIRSLRGLCAPSC